MFISPYKLQVIITQALKLTHSYYKQKISANIVPILLNNVETATHSPFLKIDSTFLKTSTPYVGSVTMVTASQQA